MDSCKDVTVVIIGVMASVEHTWIAFAITSSVA